MLTNIVIWSNSRQIAPLIPRHCEPPLGGVATQGPRAESRRMPLDCDAALAMTGMGTGQFFVPLR